MTSSSYKMKLSRLCEEFVDLRRIFFVPGSPFRRVKKPRKATEFTTENGGNRRSENPFPPYPASRPISLAYQAARPRSGAACLSGRSGGPRHIRLRQRTFHG